MPSFVSFFHGSSTSTNIQEAPPSRTGALRPKATDNPNVFSRLIGLGMRPWRRRALREAFAAARLALGERMFAAGIDEGELAGRIAAVGDKLLQSGASKTQAAALRTERVRLLMRLADAALEADAPLPGADHEYDEARRAEAALRDYQTSIAEYDSLLGWCKGRNGNGRRMQQPEKLIKDCS